MKFDTHLKNVRLGGLGSTIDECFSNRLIVQGFIEILQVFFLLGLFF